MKAISAIMAIFLSGAASANTQCAPFDDAVAALRDGYGESPIFWGMTASGGVNLWFNQDSETWTITVTDQTGMTCIVASGQPGGTIALPIPGVSM